MRRWETMRALDREVAAKVTEMKRKRFEMERERKKKQKRDPRGITPPFPVPVPF